MNHVQWHTVNLARCFGIARMHYLHLHMYLNLSYRWDFSARCYPIKGADKMLARWRLSMISWILQKTFRYWSSYWHQLHSSSWNFTWRIYLGLTMLHLHQVSIKKSNLKGKYTEKIHTSAQGFYGHCQLQHPIKIQGHHQTVIRRESWDSEALMVHCPQIDCHKATWDYEQRTGLFNFLLANEEPWRTLDIKSFVEVELTSILDWGSCLFLQELFHLSYFPSNPTAPTVLVLQFHEEWCQRNNSCREYCQCIKQKQETKKFKQDSQKLHNLSDYIYYHKSLQQS